MKEEEKGINSMEKESSQNSQTELTINKQKTIKKNKKRKVQQAGWVPLIYISTLNYDNQPIYIPFFKKMMKKYDDETYNKYRNYGFTDSGFCSIDQIKLDYEHQNIQLSINNYSFGIKDFSFLIETFKSYQDQQYYELALLLEKYKIKCQSQMKELEQVINFVNQIKYVTQEELNQSFNTFVEDAINWVEDNIENQIYEISLGLIDFEQKIPNFKKKIFSKNYIQFIAGDLQTFYHQLCQKNMKMELKNLINGQDFNGRVQLQKKINGFRQILNEEKQIEVEDEVITIEGLVIPTKRQSKMLYYNHKDRQITTQENLLFFVIRTYDFDANHIEHLINLRNEAFYKSIQNIQQNNQQQSYSEANIIQNFDYLCQQEYFLEKFKYV